MFGVVSNVERKIVSEFFELFKTPWEYYQEETHYSVILTTEDTELLDADLMIICTAKTTAWDRSANIKTTTCSTNGRIDINGQKIAIYGQMASFTCEFKPLGTVTDDGHTIIFETTSKKRGIIRIGYNMLDEVRHMLAVGQPRKSSARPTVEAHIDILRQGLIRWKIPFVEIPPAPHGKAFFVCLTHDVDFFRLSDHLFDHTFFGFIYRAVIGEFLKLLRGNGTIKRTLLNWWTLFKLPFVFLRLAQDPWPGFERYAKWEKHLGATYYLIPFKHRAGRSLEGGRAPTKRATHYDAGDIAMQIQFLERSGFEIGLHGIDAWSSPADGRIEASHLSDFTCNPVEGVRMHWLYLNDQTHQALEEAGFVYDSSVGYNDAVGFKSGTAQVYRPLGTSRLLELPMIMQDTALFYPDRMNLSEKSAWPLVDNLIDELKQYGGCLTVNWHHRSIAPERLWGDFYKMLLQILEQNSGCFLAGQNVVAWFEARRQANFKVVQFTPDRLHFEIGSSDRATADLALRIYHPALQSTKRKSQSFRELPFTGQFTLSMPLEELTGDNAIAG